MRAYAIPLIILLPFLSFSQNEFETDPSKAQFVTSDIPLFWDAFDKMEENKKAFKDYIEHGSQGVRDFIPYRIESAKNLYKTVQKRKSDYEKRRIDSFKVEGQIDQIRGYYSEFQKIYQKAVFPPTYCVIGAFNSGGTSTQNGLIIGVEMTSINIIPYTVAHELVHFNQKFPEKSTLLTQSINEGVADFIGELISGGNINQEALKYFNANESELCEEFVSIMNDSKYQGWLYGSSGKKEGRPNDLGYSIGYKISKAYYDNSDDKKKAVDEILNIEDYDLFLEASGYLSQYLN